MPQLAVCCAGSLLGVVHPKEPFPVGKVTFLHLHPLSYGEFIQARDAAAFTAWSQITRRSAVPGVVHERLMSLLREYLVVGGMPEVVATCVAQPPAGLRTFELVRRKQQDLLTAYMGDFSKYAEAVRGQEIVALFESIPSQLSRENKRFRPSQALAGGRFSRLKNALDWLVGAGIAHKVHVANSAELPFSAFTQENRLKLYLLDVGLLGALARLAPAALMAPPDLFATFRGAFCENFVAQEFVYATDAPQYAWASNTSEVEFLREVEGAVFPVEVKAGLSGKLKSLNVFADKYRPAYRVRISGRNLEINPSSGLHSYPLYLAGRFPLPE
jgi:predicted AAA+ superfamily ATPase